MLMQQWSGGLIFLFVVCASECWCIYGSARHHHHVCAVNSARHACRRMFSMLPALRLMLLAVTLRVVLPLDAAADRRDAGAALGSAVDSFFPFDPYLLRRSSRYLPLKVAYVWYHRCQSQSININHCRPWLVTACDCVSLLFSL